MTRFYERCEVCGRESFYITVVGMGCVNSDGEIVYSRGPACSPCIAQHATISMDRDVRRLIQHSVGRVYQHFVSRVRQESLARGEEPPQ